jgi:hypothetical protein
MEYQQEELPNYTRDNKEPSTPEIDIGERVKIKKLDQDSKLELDSEDYYYLKDFENKIGTICELTESRTGTFSYRVDFDEKHFGYFYRDDFEIVP